ncbi:hypothetical protein JFV30_07270 [Pseudomonas sp. TH32]|uniref:hypothetical protein n=1 Tax=Pseudomonas sp. TH32 TaxID=2796397 RepID=UPI001911A981|nr:hypothetical protein [Pseudomonas sp. TH32]MBK5436661.1 hypothetical protein [Pseudomonas sp. TH32]
MNIQFRQHSRDWLKAGNGNGGPSAAARVAYMIEMIVLYRTGALEESKFLEHIKNL